MIFKQQIKDIAFVQINCMLWGQMFVEVFPLFFVISVCVITQKKSHVLHRTLFFKVITHQGK